MNQPREIAALRPVVEVLESLGVLYYVGGSMASSVHGVPRSTIDVDLVADLQLGQLSQFVQGLCDHFYVSESAARDAVAHRRSFNVIHLASMYKVDVFALKDRTYTQAECARVVQTPLAGDPSRTYPVASPEDTILNKLEWYRDGDGVSDRQWSDLVNVMKVQGHALDNFSTNGQALWV